MPRHLPPAVGRKEDPKILTKSKHVVNYMNLNCAGANLSFKSKVIERLVNTATTGLEHPEKDND